MNITFGKTSDDRRKVSKNITGVKEFTNAELKRPTDLLNPVILIKEFNRWDKVNYCYIPKLDRYYFVENIVLGLGGILEIHCSIDVLETYKSEIYNLNVLVTRQSGQNVDGKKRSDFDNVVSKLFEDGNVPMFAQRSHIVKSFPKSLSDGFHYYLTVTGGVF